MAAWKKARTDNVGPIQHKFYQGPILRARLDEPSQERISVEVHHKNELVAQDTEVVETRNFETTLRNGDQQDALSAEQAQQALSNNES